MRVREALEVALAQAPARLAVGHQDPVHHHHEDHNQDDNDDHYADLIIDIPPDATKLPGPLTRPKRNVVLAPKLCHSKNYVVKNLCLFLCEKI